MIESDVVVVGAGVMGAATARGCARRGHNVRVIEQFRVGHTRGSSHGRSRIFRVSYPDPAFVEMAQEAMSLWRRVEDEAARRVLLTTGGLDAGDAIESNVEALSQCGAPFELLSGSDAGDRWPNLSFQPDERVLFQPNAGIVAAGDAVRALLHSAVASGATLHEDCRVEEIHASDDGVEVHTGGEVFAASVAVVTAGAWAKDLLGRAGITLDVVPTRETVAYFRIEGDVTPTFVEWGEPSLYALYSPGHGIKAAEHHAGPITDPDDEGALDEESIARVSKWVSQRFRAADPTPVYAENCIYTNTPDEHFVLERHGTVVVGSACSGHGFKFAPLIGERLAALAAEAGLD